MSYLDDWNCNTRHWLLLWLRTSIFFNRCLSMMTAIFLSTSANCRLNSFTLVGVSGTFSSLSRCDMIFSSISTNTNTMSEHLNTFRHDRSCQSQNSFGLRLLVDKRICLFWFKRFWLQKWICLVLTIRMNWFVCCFSISNRLCVIWDCLMENERIFYGFW